MKKYFVISLFITLIIQGISFATTKQKQIPSGEYICPQSCIAEKSTYLHYLRGCNAEQAMNYINHDECTYIQKNYNTYTCKYQQGTCTVVTDSNNTYKAAKCNFTGSIDKAIDDVYNGRCQINK